MPALLDVEAGYVWESPPHKIGLARSLAFGLVTGDLNPIHIIPFIGLFYRSRLGDRPVCHGAHVVSRLGNDIHKVFSGSKVEIISRGYESFLFDAPLQVGETFRNVWTLSEVTKSPRKVRCLWQIQVLGSRGNKIAHGNWEVFYYPVVARDWVTGFWNDYGSVVHRLPC